MPLRRPAFARRCLFLLFTIVLAACSPKMDWRELHFDDGAFTVLFPQKPGQAEHRLETPLGTVTMKMYSVRIDETLLGAGFADFPQAVDAHTIDMMRDALVKSLRGKVVSDKPISYAGPNAVPGREVLIDATLGEGQKSAPGEMRAHLYARDNRYYQVVLVGRKGAFDANDADMFLNSFKPY